MLNSFSVVNRKNMFVYQERTTKSVFYLRLLLLIRLCLVESTLVHWEGSWGTSPNHFERLITYQQDFFLDRQTE